MLAAARTIVVDEQGAINVQKAAVITVQAEAPHARHWQLDMPSELQTHSETGNSAALC